MLPLPLLTSMQLKIYSRVLRCHASATKAETESGNESLHHNHNSFFYKFMQRDLCVQKGDVYGQHKTSQQQKCQRKGLFICSFLFRVEFILGLLKSWHASTAVRKARSFEINFTVDSQSSSPSTLHVKCRIIFHQNSFYCTKKSVLSA